MKFDVLTIKDFEKAAKRLISKYPSLKGEIGDLIEKLSVDPLIGSSLGSGCYKIRLAIKSKKAGKSRGARVISLVKIIDSEVYLLTIYDKSEKDDIRQKELNDLVKMARAEKDNK